MVLDDEKMKRIAREIQHQLDSMNFSVRFSRYGRNNEKISIEIVEKETGKIIREIPSEDLQNLYTKLDELVGVMLNKVV